MKKALYLLLMLLSACSSTKTELEGIWIVTSVQFKGSDKEAPSNGILMEFESDSLRTIIIKDNNIANFTKQKIDASKFLLTDSTITVFHPSDTTTFIFRKENNWLSLESSGESPNIKLQLSRIDKSIGSPTQLNESFKGVFHIKSDNYSQKIDFINDTLLIYCDDNSSYTPVKKWETYSYKGVHYLSIIDSFTPVYIISNLSKDDITLNSYVLGKETFTLSSIATKKDKSLLYGDWIEVKNSNPHPPFPTELSEKEIKLKLQIRQDSIGIDQYTRITQLNWGLTEDGKIIYFPDFIMRENATMRIKSLNADTLIIERRTTGIYNNEEVDLVRIKEN